MGCQAHRPAENVQRLPAQLLRIAHPAAPVLLQRERIHRRVVGAAVLQHRVPFRVHVAPGLQRDPAPYLLRQRSAAAAVGSRKAT